VARRLNDLIKKIERVLREDFLDFRSGLESAESAERVLGFVVSSDFEGRDDRDRQGKLKTILEGALSRDELRLVGPIVTMTPAEAEIDWTWDRLLRLWQTVVERIGTLADHDDANWWMRSSNRTLRKCLEDFVAGEDFPRSKWTAAHQQIKFGLTPQRALTNPSHARTWIRNHAAALEAGFLRTRDLPRQMKIGA
jgi:hypothetical protein